MLVEGAQELIQPSVSFHRSGTEPWVAQTPASHKLAVC